MGTLDYSGYPFAAIVGQEDMKLALCLNAVQPHIGGVLILGERGTAKTTAVRGLPAVLEDASRVVELPLNATEDRVVGTLRVDALMKTGEREFVPGVLAEADGNILYVDEINLLEDHIVDLLLDAAATGVCRVERDGVSQTYPAHFVLVGTMNPEEGMVRPQLLDRFGLSVRVAGNLAREERLELVRRQIAFEDDPDGFRAHYAEQEQSLARRIAEARKRYPQVTFSDGMASLAAGVCSHVGVDGYRADITMMRAARAVAALGGRGEVAAEDVFAAARFALPHRVKRLPFEEAGLTDAVLKKAMDAALKDGALPEPGETPRAQGAERGDGADADPGDSDQPDAVHDAAPGARARNDADALREGADPKAQGQRG